MQKKILIVYKILLFTMLLVNTVVCFGQSLEKKLDTAFAKQTNRGNSSYHPTFLFVSTKPWIKYNPVCLAMGSLMFIYQDVLSPQISAECPYEISCSNFGKAVIKRYGLIKGIALTAGRLMRCNKIGSVDIHPLYIDAKGKIIDDPEQYRLK